MPRATDFETEKRVTEVYNQLLSGTARSEILQYAAKTWNIESRATDSLIAKANQLFKKHAKTHRDREFGKSIMRLENLYARSLRVQDFKTCLSIQKEINILLGLNAPQQIEMGVDISPEIAKQVQDLGLNLNEVLKHFLSFPKPDEAA